MSSVGIRTLPGAAPLDERTWFGHPRGLTILFLTEMWQEFSFFGMRTLLVYYMTQQLLLSQRASSLIYGLYNSLAYFTPLIGGVVCDRWLGRRRTVLLGGGMMAVGHFMMAFEATFYPALALIALGNGLFLPSLSSQINLLYEDGDARKTSAYNIYYVGINFGGFLAPFACGTVGELFGWHWGFTLAGIGMVAGLIVYIVGTPLLPSEQGVPQVTGTPRAARDEKPGLDRGTVLILVVIVILVVVYRSAYEQVGNTVALWAENGVNRTVGHWTIPMTWFQALNPLGIFLFTPVIVARWTRRARKGKDRPAVAKMATGAVILAVSYLMLSALSVYANHTGTRTSWLWLALFFFTFTWGELFILPVGLSLFGRIAPEKYAASMIAAWFAAACFGNLGAGALGTLWSAMPPWQFFAIVAAVAAVAGGLLLALVPRARGIEPGVRVEPSP
jgi:POT family proton-dependent oligopeptide transporter